MSLPRASHLQKLLPASYYQRQGLNTILLLLSSGAVSSHFNLEFSRKTNFQKILTKRCPGAFPDLVEQKIQLLHGLMTEENS